MSKKKRPANAARKPPQPTQLPVLHGDCFRTFLEEARSIGNEVTARRQFDADVLEYLAQKGLLEEWEAWRQAKNAPPKA